MENNELKQKNNKKGILIILVVLGLLLIGGGAALSFLGAPKRVTSMVINKLSTNMENLMKDNKDVTGINESFTATSNIKFNMQSDYFQALAQMSPEYATFAKLFTNLSNTETNMIIAQDTKNQKLFMNWNSSLNQQELLAAKYLIENNTEYYFINGAVPNYINNGNNNYFESLTSSTTTNENLVYVIKTTAKLIGENLKDEYFTETTDGDYRKITLTLNQKNYAELANNVLAGLKKDDKANKILTGYDKDFAKSKVSVDNENNKSVIEFIIYTDKLLSQPKKYELKFIGDGQTSGFTYYKEENQGIVEIKNNDKTVGTMKITTKDNKTDINILDEKGTSLGTITINKTDTNQDILINIKNETAAIEISYNSKLSNIEKNKSYDMDTTMSIKVTSNNMNLINGIISAKTQVTSEANINEDISTSVLASSVTPEQQALLDQKMTTILLSLMS